MKYIVVSGDGFFIGLDSINPTTPKMSSDPLCGIRMEQEEAEGISRKIESLGFEAYLVPVRVARITCSFDGCSKPICKEEVASQDHMLFCREHYDQLMGFINANEIKKILGFWVKSNGGARKLARTF
jgi:hypothetical protein